LLKLAVKSLLGVDSVFQCSFFTLHLRNGENMADLTGKTISHYKVLEKIGEGGMGVVYKAKDNKLKRTVALKFLHPHTIDDQEKRARFFLEAQAAASLNHPNICTIYEIDETTTDDRQIFIAMEYVEGQNLQQKIETGSFKFEQTLDIAIQIAEGMCEAHSKGVIHRDIKSANIMVTDKGQVKIMDFGLAKLTNGAKITRDGKTLGTMAYISPEQARGGDVDHRTDIWSLGVILYEMITGQLPFEGESEVAMVVSVLNNEPKPLDFSNKGVPKGLEGIILKCLEKDIEDRYQTTDQLLIDLKNLKIAFDSGTDVIPQVIHHPKRLKAPKKVIRFALVTLLIFAALITTIYYTIFFERIKTPRVVNVRPVTRTTAIFEAGAQISPDGSSVVYCSAESGNHDVWIRQIASGERLNLTVDYEGEDAWPYWSPDGNWILFNSTRDGGGLYKVSLFGGTPIRIAAFGPDGITRDYSMSPDGLSLAYADSGRLYTMKISEGIPHHIQLPHKCRIPTWTPDGTRILYLSGSLKNTTFWIVPVDGSDPMLVYCHSRSCTYPTYSNDGKILFFRSVREGFRALWWIPLNKKGMATKPAKALMPGVNCYEFSFSKDGSKLAYLEGDYKVNIYYIPLIKGRVQTIKDARQITAESQNMGEISLSPNYEWIAFHSVFRGSKDIWFVDRNGKGLRQFTDDAYIERGLSWSPDSSLLAFHSNREGNNDIWTLPVNGGPAKQLTTHSANDENPCWSPDGKKIVFSSKRSGEWQVWILTIGSGELKQLTKNRGDHYFPGWSPDGRTIAFFSYQEEDGGKICLVPAKGGEARHLTRLGKSGYTKPIWSPNGKTIFYSYDPGEDDPGRKIYAITVADGSKRIIFDNKGSQEPGVPMPWLATDGEKLFFVVRKFSSDIMLADLVYE